MTHPPTIVFAHANGFPAGTYRVLFDAWRAAGWRVCAVDKFGPAFANVLGTCRIWVNGEGAERSTAVRPSDEVAVLPPVSGG